MQVAFFEPQIMAEARARAQALARKAEAEKAAPASALQRRAAGMAVPAAPAPEDSLAKPVIAADVTEAAIEAGAYQANFQVPGRATIPQDGNSKTVTLTQRKAEATLAARTVPELEQKAYLEAGFTHDEEAPLLAGRIALHRDGTYVGMGQFNLVAPGDKVELGFGADDRIKVSFAPVKRRENEPSWLGQTRTDLREFRTVVKSLHAKPVKVTVLERIPFSESSGITVETIAAQTTPPTEKQVGDRRGVASWTFDLAPGAEKEIKLAYRIKWPGDRELSFEEQPLPGK
jgi:uncharacterized protein (TIGR02231 family)